ncbi:UDP-glucose 6-dehydrogenase [uncultured Desulfobacterium sp.]|uniref:UDP-glucose 6-dehydrogenase n=1 Tax=uncultured Desulfobacterium sp. TaxID=201089 RepID=A0A445MRR6_9BACT|nr:UDP-glucose 6-dehydrogenase [uncultured Desulfobacterium sp.]
MTFKKKMLCIGAGYVGGPTMAMIAHKCPQYKVTVVDINPKRIAQWNSGELPIYEPGLDEIVKATRGVNLFFSTEIEKEIRECHIIFVSVNTPTKTFGAGAGMAADLQYWEKTARQILRNAESDKIIVEKSTLPVKTALAMERILTSGNNNIHFDVLSNPEFLAEGTAIKDLKDPDRVLIGSRRSPEGLRARDELVEIYANWVPSDRILTSNIWSCELSKLVSNAFLAQKISSINAISALCEKADADVTEVSRAVGMDNRLGSRFLNASVGFGGSCFKKDILNLVYLCQYYGLNEVADYWKAVVSINDYQKERFVLNMMNAMFNTLAGKRICLFGFAFKANTGDTRESPAIFISKRLLEERAQLIITDPKALDNAKFDLEGLEGAISYIEDPYEAATGCDAIAVMTEWDVYPKLDFKKIYDSMTKPAFVFDGRNILPHKRLFETGFNVFPVGKPPMTHF